MARSKSTDCTQSTANIGSEAEPQSNMAEVEIRATLTMFAEISKQSFRMFSAMLPSKAVRAAFTAIVAPLYERITFNFQESRTIAALRDALMPKLLSGEIAAPRGLSEISAR